jgi:hypothetical protein
MSNHSTERGLRDENARLQQLVQEQDALLVQQQQAAATKRKTYARHTQESIILDLVVPQFVGASEYCFLAGVSRGWRAQQLKLSFAQARSIERTTDKLRTAYRAALTTVSRLAWAFDSGLTVAAIRDDLTALQLVNLVQKVAVNASTRDNVLNWACFCGIRWNAEHLR